VDFCVLPAELGVAENGACWIVDHGGANRAAAFLTQHLAVVVRGDTLVHNLHEAYQRIAIPSPGFLMWLSGPSKTADIEQALVLGFVEELHRTFEPRRQELLKKRAERYRKLADGDSFDFLPETAKVRSGDWRVAATPADLQKRHVEITGPVERKMMINALNSGADVFMADFEDALSPTWSNVVQGHLNLMDA